MVSAKSFKAIPIRTKTLSSSTFYQPLSREFLKFWGLEAMLPRLVARLPLARHYGLCMRKFSSEATTTQKISLILSTKTPKQVVIEALHKHFDRLPRKSINTLDGGAAIFASPSFATWLRDDSFIEGLLGTLFDLGNHENSKCESLDALCAVTDGLTPKTLFSEPQTGFSILYGPTKNLLPGLWDLDSYQSVSDQDIESSVSFLSSPLPKDTRPLEITLPLANTVFHTGSRTTLFASHWQRDRLGNLAHSQTSTKLTQRICPDINLADHTRPLLPFLPLIPPRRIVAGLGNIVRQVEVDGSPTPASKELESLVPRIFDIRSKRDVSYSPGPIGVWCWILPPHVVEKYNLLNLKVFEAESPQSEAELTLQSMNMFSELISSGCRLHKILSGGGGWGLKQGLLSLDPETQFSLPNQDDQHDIEMFIRAFKDIGNPNPSEGLVTPGSYIMFCIEPHLTEKEIGASRQMAPMTALGVAPSGDQEPDSASQSNDIEIIDNHFGVVSKAGLFLKATTLSHMDNSSASKSAEQPQVFTTKIDSPRASFLLYGPQI
ncbi:uncharacterized protein F4807DRAFT_48494 [Annulohypoxylon truncatum]|uniref:uncharacterized protein n=1 Tax=Annulohypoxylon truncatum TaxID=327061 RepID=UPI002007DCD6|nr:uncharacterized protein F4807DRAFT_48494 [Annulohypoxylon truncatum]KAI1211055.1 hypothetical protein F4807DRAFT_48494 [Annulohypoxylon truncatum]